jgi:hypothetical protein
VLVAIASATASTVDMWDGFKQALLVALSVIEAGVLVRLARGLPFTSPELYDVDEIRELTAAIQQIARALRALFVVTLATMIGLVMLKPVSVLIENDVRMPYSEYLIHYGVLGVAGFMVGFVFSRMYRIVAGDYDLTILQSKFIVRAVERRQAKRFEDRKDQEMVDKFKNPDGYGRIIQ